MVHSDTTLRDVTESVTIAAVLEPRDESSVYPTVEAGSHAAAAPPPLRGRLP